MFMYSHGHHQMANTKIRLIIFFATKDGEALYSQYKQDLELTGSNHQLLIAELRLKLKKKGAIRRALFLHNRSPGHSKNMTISRGGQMQCEELIAYLRVRHTFMFLIFLCIIFSSE